MNQPGVNLSIMMIFKINMKLMYLQIFMGKYSIIQGKKKLCLHFEARKRGILLIILVILQ